MHQALLEVSESVTVQAFNHREQCAGVDRQHMLRQLPRGMHPLAFQDLIEVGEGFVRTVMPMRKDDANPFPGIDEGYPSVIRRPDGVWQMWAHDRYWESDEGVTWRAPKLHRQSTNGSPHCNLVFHDVAQWDPYLGRKIPPHMPAVTWDDAAADEDLRYRAFGLFLVSPGSGHLTAYASRDGIDWRVLRERAIIVRNDSQHRGFRDPANKRWRVYHRPGWNARMISLSESHDADGLDFCKAHPCLEPDVQDKLRCIEHYAISVFPYDGGYIGFLKMYEKRWDSRRCWIELVVSRDGFNWQRLPDRTPFLPLGDDNAWDAYCHSPGHSLVEVEDGHWFYYDSWNTAHVGPLEQSGKVGVGRAFLPRRKLMRCIAATSQSWLRTHAMLLDGRELRVDVDARGGELRAALQRFDGSPIPGYTAADCIPVTTEGLATPLRFTGGDLSRWVDQPLRIVFAATKGVKLDAIGLA